MEPDAPAPCTECEDAHPFAHEVMSGTHSHPHSPYGTQGGDETHAHSHTHDNNNTHDHAHPNAVAAAATRWTGPQSFTADAAGTLAIVLPAGAATWGIEHRGEGWHVTHYPTLTAAGTAWQGVGNSSYTTALEELAVYLAVQAEDRPALAQGWTSEMAYEGVSTGDGRYIDPGAIDYRDTPLPLMLQTENAPGHETALLAGTITATGKLGTTAIGAGSFDRSPVGQQFVDIIAARGRFGVSIDVAQAEGEPVCADHGPADPDTCDYDCPIEMHFSLIQIMGLTGTPFPAFADAHIVLAAAAAPEVQPTPSVPTAAVPAAVEAALAATGTPSRFAVPGEVQVGLSAAAGDPHEIPERGVAAYVGTTPPLSFSVSDAYGNITTYSDTVTGTVATYIPNAVVAAAAAVTEHRPPPAYLLADPGFEPGDHRLVTQPDGQTLCPLTIEPPDADGWRRVYGHVAGWRSCHTGHANRCVVPPHSNTNCSAFNLRPIVTAEGDLVNVGHLTMGMGHASTERNPSTGRWPTPDEVRDHYDGGPGAIRMSTVTMGEDPYGPWVSGYVEPAATDAQVAAFAACSLSGDWREVWEGKGLDILAVLAGVNIPGFVIVGRRDALVASAVAAALANAGVTELPAGHAAWQGDRVVAMVASGVIRQPEPWERDMAELHHLVAAQTAELARLGRMLAPLAPMAASAILASMSSGHTTT